MSRSSAAALPDTPGTVDQDWRLLSFSAHVVTMTPPEQWEGNALCQSMPAYLLSDDPALSARYRLMIRQHLRRLRRPKLYGDRIVMALQDIELSALIAENQRLGVRAPVREAEDVVARRWGHASGPALNRWRRRVHAAQN
jgi:hypothetical protein